VAAATDVKEFGSFGPEAFTALGYGGELYELAIPAVEGRLPEVVSSADLGTVALALDPVRGADVLVAAGRDGVLSVDMPSGQTRRLVLGIVGHAVGVHSAAAGTYVAMGPAGVTRWSGYHRAYLPLAFGPQARLAHDLASPALTTAVDDNVVAVRRVQPR
jgi:hypothetical protein